MNDAAVLSDTQLQKVLDAIHALKDSSSHWDQFIPVFLSAFLAMLVGISLEYFKSSREKHKLDVERQKRELQQINGVIVGIAYNVERLLHATFQNLLPHYEQSHAAYAVLMATDGDGNKIRGHAASYGKNYPALMMTCPDMHFVEFDFLEKLPFLIARNAELVKKAAWMVSYSRIIATAIADRNKDIADANRLVSGQGGALNFHQLHSILQLQTAVSNSECVHALRLFETFLSIAQSLHQINDTYRVEGEKTKFIAPDALEEALEKLGAISETCVAEMPS
jgi:hypothetical protein